MTNGPLALAFAYLRSSRGGGGLPNRGHAYATGDAGPAAGALPERSFLLARCPLGPGAFARLRAHRCLRLWHYASAPHARGDHSSWYLGRNLTSVMWCTPVTKAESLTKKLMFVGCWPSQLLPWALLRLSPADHVHGTHTSDTSFTYQLAYSSTYTTQILSPADSDSGDRMYTTGKGRKGPRVVSHPKVLEPLPFLQNVDKGDEHVALSARDRLTPVAQLAAVYKAVALPD